VNGISSLFSITRNSNGISTLIAIAVLVLALMVPDYLNKKNAALPFFVSAYLVAFLTFTFLFVKGNKPRYAISIEFWHILVMSVGLLALHRVANQFFRNKAIIWVVLLLLFWNIPHTLVPILHTTPGYAPITSEFHYDLSTAYNYFKGRELPGDVLIASPQFDLYARWLGGLKFDHILSWSSEQHNVESEILQAIKAHPHGWIVLTSRGDDLYSQPLLPQDFRHAGKQVKFIGWYGDQYILRWQIECYHFIPLSYQQLSIVNRPSGSAPDGVMR
jgi:hypothetical protein